MRQGLYAVRDGKVEQFFPPMCFQTPGAAERWFRDMVNNPQSGEIHRHPTDFALYQLGVYESDTGLVEARTVGLIVTGVDVVDSDIPRKVQDA